MFKRPAERLALFRAPESGRGASAGVQTWKLFSQAGENMRLFRVRLSRRAVNNQHRLQLHLLETQGTRFQAKSVRRGRNSGEARVERVQREKKPV